MSIETTLYDTLKADSGVAAIVGTKIYPHLAEEGTAAPFLTYVMVVGVPYSKISGPTGLEKKRIQVNCWANTYAGSKTLAEAVKTALASSGHLLLELDDYVDEAQIYRVIVDFSFIA